MINDQIPSKKYDLEERTLKFGKQIIALVNLLPKNQVNLKLSDQIIRSGTSVGATAWTEKIPQTLAGASRSRAARRGAGPPATTSRRCAAASD